MSCSEPYRRLIVGSSSATFVQMARRHWRRHGRIGITRALIRDNPILILDEPTAALHAESEELVIAAFERLMKGRTVITIVHRLSTLRDADKIVVIKDGIVIENGPHHELLALDGAYVGLHLLQFGEH